MHIKEHDVFRFAEELSSIDWSHHNLVFLDEVSFDNRGMIRRRGYSIKGRKLATSSGSQECQICVAKILRILSEAAFVYILDHVPFGF
ncbi:hypothetical protein PPTG_17639 [Phytophthora nicotianae INRA-310]|uniref:Tc1-like transposase DDE domain-containing protein n=1 Tax=Phytophthora nicotianae (strain INRA-310) TaxID=761204 RepID=W2PLV9_PHYN3|nr:hypothetical protein PPTG_17639 [Phytophthora nicotianae INRA-310]ETN01239.1 hypothetical protein PPTG_17639 [Phytophthora nicotianae INRA-310]